MLPQNPAPRAPTHVTPSAGSPLGEDLLSSPAALWAAAPAARVLGTRALAAVVHFRRASTEHLPSFCRASAKLLPSFHRASAELPPSFCRAFAELPPSFCRACHLQRPLILQGPAQPCRFVLVLHNQLLPAAEPAQAPETVSGKDCSVSTLAVRPAHVAMLGCGLGAFFPLFFPINCLKTKEYTH